MTPGFRALALTQGWDLQVIDGAQDCYQNAVTHAAWLGYQAGLSGRDSGEVPATAQLPASEGERVGDLRSPPLSDCRPGRVLLTWDRQFMSVVEQRPSGLLLVRYVDGTEQFAVRTDFCRSYTQRDAERFGLVWRVHPSVHK